MEENKRFRNHISIVLEQVGSGFYVMLGFFLWQFVGDEEMMADVTSGEMGSFGMWIAAAFILGLLVLIFVIQLLVWSKTYISIQGQTIVIEKNTLRKVKQTIGIKNISNVNTEQNLFERLVGTCKIKMDTNSLSTADSTDIKIVLKKSEAEAFRDYILHLLNEEEEEILEHSETNASEEGASAGAMLVHGLFSIRFTSILVAVLGLIGFVGLAADALREGFAGLLVILSELLVLGIVAVSGLWGIVKSFLRYYGFTAKRVKDKLYIQYGLLKKVNYTIPVDKINAVKFIQSPQARVAGWYSAELINVGMGDEEETEQSFFLMYKKSEQISQEIERLLPEFSGCLEKKLEKQPVSVWKAWLIPEVIFLAVLAVSGVVAAEWMPEGEGWILAGAAVALILNVLVLGLRYWTNGTLVAEETLGICQGACGRAKIFVKYDKIQYLEVKQNFMAKSSGIAKANIHLLASLANQTQSVPYFREEKAELLKEAVLTTEK